MQVVLFRHGPAGDHDPARWPSDSERPLTPKGIDRTRAAARGLDRLVDDIELIVSSPYARAHETARILGIVLGALAVETLDALAAGRGASGMLAALANLPAGETLVVVGHEPDLGALAALMIGARQPLPLKKAGACAIEFEGRMREGAGRLLWYVPPRVLRKLGGREPALDP